MAFALMLVAFVLALVATILFLVGNVKGGMAFFFVTLCIVAGVLMDVALRGG